MSSAHWLLLNCTPLRQPGFANFCLGLGSGFTPGGLLSALGCWMFNSGTNIQTATFEQSQLRTGCSQFMHSDYIKGRYFFSTVYANQTIHWRWSKLETFHLSYTETIKTGHFTSYFYVSGWRENIFSSFAHTLTRTLINLGFFHQYIIHQQMRTRA